MKCHSSCQNVIHISIRHCLVSKLAVMYVISDLSETKWLFSQLKVEEMMVMSLQTSQLFLRSCFQVFAVFVQFLSPSFCLKVLRDDFKSLLKWLQPQVDRHLKTWRTRSEIVKNWRNMMERRKVLVIRKNDKPDSQEVNTNPARMVLQMRTTKDDEQVNLTTKQEQQKRRKQVTSSVTASLTASLTDHPLFVQKLHSKSPWRSSFDVIVVSASFVPLDLESREYDP